MTFTITINRINYYVFVTDLKNGLEQYDIKREAEHWILISNRPTLIKKNLKHKAPLYRWKQGPDNIFIRGEVEKVIEAGRG